MTFNGIFTNIFVNSLIGILQYWVKNCYNSVEMTNKPRKRPRCSMCGKCCIAPVILIIKPGDYRRWVRQGRSDILQYTSLPPLQGYGDLWIDIKGSEGSVYCPFIKKISHEKYICTIHKPNQKYVKNFSVNGLMGLEIKEYLSRLNVVGLTKLRN
jgi:Fe-S-cluster containining protein